MKASALFFKCLLVFWGARCLSRSSQEAWQASRCPRGSARQRRRHRRATCAQSCNSSSRAWTRQERFFHLTTACRNPASSRACAVADGFLDRPSTQSGPSFVRALPLTEPTPCSNAEQPQWPQPNPLRPETPDDSELRCDEPASVSSPVVANTAHAGPSNGIPSESLLLYDIRHTSARDATRPGPASTCAASVQPAALTLPFSSAGQASPGPSAVHVPGSKASAVSADSVWHSLFGRILKSGTRLSRFLRYHESVSDRRQSSKHFWPLPLQEPAAGPASKMDLSTLEPADLATALMASALSFLHAGSPDVSAHSLPKLQGRKGTEYPSSLGQAVVNKVNLGILSRLRNRALAWNASGLIDAERMGRTAAKVENTEAVLSSLEQGDFQSASSGSVGLELGDPSHSLLGESCFKAEHVAKPVEAERLSFGPPPQFDPRPYLDRATRPVYDRPIACSDYAPGVEKTVPKVRVRASRTAALQLLRKLDESHRLALVPARLALRGMGAGLFSVPKSLSKDRLILDSRPFNAVESAINRWLPTLGSAASLCGLSLQPWEELRASGEDVQDFFYSFKVGDERIIRNCLRFKLTPVEAAEFSCFEDRFKSEAWLVPSLATMAMGDCQAVAVGQTSHLALVLRTGALGIEQLLLHNAPSPRSSRVFGVVLDDLVVLEKCLIREHGAGIPVDAASPAIMAAVHSAYQSAGLPRHPDKGFLLESLASFWGIELDGRKGTVNGNPARVVPLVMLTQRVAELGICTVGLLQALLGSWVSSMLLSRRTLSILDSCYRAVAGRNKPDVIRLSPSAVEELLLCCILAPLMFANLRQCFDTRLYASDASSWGEAGAFAEVPECLSREVARHTVSRGAWTRLLSGSESGTCLRLQRSCPKAWRVTGPTLCSLSWLGLFPLSKTSPIRSTRPGTSI